MDKIWEYVKENHKKLKSCNLHNFEDITPDRKIYKKYKCKNCGGELDGINVSYYHLGLKHD
jgi:hypothetical protein